MLKLDHKRQTICCRTLNAHAEGRLIERDAATTEQRIEAARKCQQAGYTVRFRISAVCPVHDWQRENREMLDMLFDNVKPDLITLETLGHMDHGRFERSTDTSLFEPDALEAIRAAEQEMKSKQHGPFPDELREEICRFLTTQICRHSPDTPVSLCQEAPGMWTR